MGPRLASIALFAWLLLAAGLPAALAQETPPEAPAEGAETLPIEDASLLSYWQERLARAQQRIELARERADEAEAEYARARHDGYPRGEALSEIKERHHATQRELRMAEEALPRLVEQARRAGVPPGVLRDYRGDATDDSEEG
jgi:hypothetical protein